MKVFSAMNLAVSQARHKDRIVDPGMARAEGGNVSILAGNVAVITNNPTDAPGTAQRRFNINVARVAAIEAVITHRHGGPCDTDDWAAYASVAFNAVALRAAGNGRRATPQALVAWAAAWLPTAPTDFVIALAEKVCARPRRITARRAGELVGLREVEWRSLDLKTVHPVDVLPEAIAAERRARKAATDAARYQRQRSLTGRQTRQQYEGQSMAAEAKREGVSRQALYARRKRAEREVDRSFARNSKEVSISGETPVNLAPSSRPLLSDDTRRAAMARLCDAAIAAFSNPPARSAPPMKAAR
ncbi:hypothetical protein [Camelimonas lactis]|uniref:hypothetical protein n=1 Tax=Camelimonas lactis TaxID=659006 RepID=UPI00104AE566|nr:hypothetical protein [Camelimonas lactis]